MINGSEELHLNFTIEKLGPIVVVILSTYSLRWVTFILSFFKKRFIGSDLLEIRLVFDIKSNKETPDVLIRLSRVLS